MIDGITPLFAVAQEGHTEIVTQLLAAGADVNQANTNGATPLYKAAQEGHIEIVAQLLAAKGLKCKSGRDRWNNAFICCSTRGSYRNSNTIASSRSRCKSGR